MDDFAAGDTEFVHDEDDAAEAVAADVDDEEDFDAPPVRRSSFTAFKRLRQAAPAQKTVIGEPPWWASTDPEVFAAGQQAAIERGRRIKVPGQDNVIAMKGVF
jgi:hypothetical protein